MEERDRNQPKPLLSMMYTVAETCVVHTQYYYAQMYNECHVCTCIYTHTQLASYGQSMTDLPSLQSTSMLVSTGNIFINTTVLQVVYSHYQCVTQEGVCIHVHVHVVYSNSLSIHPSISKPHKTIFCQIQTQTQIQSEMDDKIGRPCSFLLCKS